MLKILFFVGWMMAAVCLLAQDATLTVGSRQLVGDEVAENSWVFRDDLGTIVAVPREAYQELLDKIEQLEADTVRLNGRLQICEGLLEKYENYEQAADNHILVQKQLLSTADSLYEGYKGLYRDLKKLYGISTFSVIPGVGYYWNPGRNGLYGSLGIGYKDFQSHFQVGDNYKGLQLGYRISFP